jgi:MFS family permease
MVRFASSARSGYTPSMPAGPYHHQYRKKSLVTFSLLPILVYSLVMFVMNTGDAIMSYVSPVILETHLHSALVMGIVLSFSSFIGFFCDLFFGEWFRGKSYRFYIALAFCMAFLFPLSFLLPPWLIAFFFAMGVWGVYYESLGFAHFHLIHSYVKPVDHAASWGILQSFLGASYLLGPILAGYFLDIGERMPFYVTVFFYTMGLLGYGLFLKFFSKYERHTKEDEAESKAKKHSLFTELKIWTVLWKKVWPLYIFLFVTFIVDAAFWSIGTVLGEELRHESAFGWLLFPAHTLPLLFVGLFAKQLSLPFGKKRVSFFAGIGAGIVLALSALIRQPELYILSIFVFSILFAFIVPEISAAFEDYVSRLGNIGNDMVGLRNSAASLAYVIGPIAAGAAAEFVGVAVSIAATGILLLAVSIMCLVVVPRKIKMPEKELEIVEAEA